MMVSLFHGLTQTPANNVKGRLSNQRDSYHPDRQRDSRDRRRDRHDYDDIHQNRPSKRRRSNSRSLSPPRRPRHEGPLEECAKGEPVDLFNVSHTTLDEIFEKIEKEELYNFPKDGDKKLEDACEALSHALQKASIAKADTPEVKQAVDNLREAYDEAANSNAVSMRYIDVE